MGGTPFGSGQRAGSEGTPFRPSLPNTSRTDLSAVFKPPPVDPYLTEVHTTCMLLAGRNPWPPKKIFNSSRKAPDAKGSRLGVEYEIIREGSLRESVALK